MDKKIIEYQNKVAKILERDYFTKEEGWIVEKQTAVKNNNVKLSGITVRKDEVLQAAPVMYVDDYYKEGYSEEATAQSIFECYQRSKEEFQNANINSVLDFNEIKDKICYKLINARMNAANDAPFIPVTEDLMLSFYIQFRDDATINIDNKVTNVWGIEKEKAAEQLYLLAEENMNRIHPITVQSMMEVMKKMMPADLVEEMPEINEGDFPMYVVSNKSKLNGAAVLVYGKGEALQDCMEQISNELGKPISGFYILPSYIHECILIPESEALDANELRKMVMDVNQSQVEPNEVLSDNVFHYDKEDGLKQVTFSSRERSR